MTTRQLAEQIEVVPATILMYEQNKHPIPFDVANSLADALDVNADLLYDDFAVFLAAPSRVAALLCLYKAHQRMYFSFWIFTWEGSLGGLFLTLERFPLTTYPVSEVI